MIDILCLCTGNATRSVLAEILLQDALPRLRVASAGTLVVEGQPISWRTRAAFDAIDVPAPPHRGRQVDDAMLDDSRLVLAADPEHVGWIRRRHPSAAARTVTMKRLARSLRTAPADASIATVLTTIAPDEVVLETWEEIVDPGGGEVEGYVACAHEIAGVVDELAPLLADRFAAEGAP